MDSPAVDVVLHSEYGMYVYVLVATCPVVQDDLLLCIQAGEGRQWLVRYIPIVWKA